MQTNISLPIGDIRDIRQLLAKNPLWHRTRISRELCKLWDWRNANGQLKDMACRTLLLKLERAGHITLPIRRREAANHSRGNVPIMVKHSTERISCSFKSLVRVKIIAVQPRSKYQDLFNCLLMQYQHHNPKELLNVGICLFTISYSLFNAFCLLIKITQKRLFYICYIIAHQFNAFFYTR